MSVNNDNQNRKESSQSFAKCEYSLREKLKLNSSGEAYILGLASEAGVIAASLSDLTVNIMEASNASLKSVSTLRAHTDSITGLKFSPQSNSTIFTSSKDGRILTWDLRNNDLNKPVQIFHDNTSETLKPINCFDIDQSGNFLCGGTDQVGEDAFILFWDNRSTKLLGGYWDSHTDDITDVCYNHNQKDKLISGSVDGLINVFDVSEASEDDALLHTLNTESSVAKLYWTEKNQLACITHIEEMQIWDSDEIELIKTYTREMLMSILNTKVDYLIEVFNFPKHSKDSMLMTGTADGVCQIWSLESDEACLWTTLENGHSDVVRSVSLLEDVLVTGSEDGVVCLWSLDVSDTGKDKSDLKLKHSKSKIKPY